MEHFLKGEVPSILCKKALVSYLPNSKKKICIFCSSHFECIYIQQSKKIPLAFPMWLFLQLLDPLTKAAGCRSGLL